MVQNLKETGCAAGQRLAGQDATAGYLLHAGVAAGQLLPEVGDVMVVLLQVLLEVVAPEGQQRFLHLGVELWGQRPQR